MRLLRCLFRPSLPRAEPRWGCLLLPEYVCSNHEGYTEALCTCRADPAIGLLPEAIRWSCGISPQEDVPI